jgi:hypothetical protein
MNEFWNGKVYTFFSLNLKSNFIFQTDFYFIFLEISSEKVTQNSISLQP